MVTLKIEDNIDGITGIKKITSKSLENTSTIIVEIENDVNNQLVVQDIKMLLTGLIPFLMIWNPPRFL